MGNDMSGNKILLWDPLVRLFHWSIAGVFIANYWLNETGEKWHEWLGYFAVAFLLVRFVWGFVGHGAARWSDFFPSYTRLKLHFCALINRRPYHRMGHSPLGALVMILMMLLILMLGVSGFMMEEIDYFWGEDWVQDLHSWSADALLGLVAVHVVAGLFESYRLKENLPKSMITGKRNSIDTNHE
jgi:cytochrome b